MPTVPANGDTAPPLIAAALPRVRVVLAGHLVFTFLYALLFANIVWLMPMLVRLRFGSPDPQTRDWQTAAITASIPTFMVLSIFWNELLRRVTLRRYLLVFWLVAVLPLGLAGWIQNYGQLLACHVVANIGLAAWTPLNGKLLKHFYPDALRGRAYSVINAVTQASGIGAVILVGRWQALDSEAFRTYFPAAAVLQVLAIGILVWLARLTRAPDPPPVAERWSWSTALHPVLHMREVLRSDRTFLRYEQAFMTYGAAFMLCDSLLPILATTKLGMRYEEYAYSTQMVLRIAMLLVTLPMGWVLDRFGPMHASALAFGILGFYPLGLLAAGGPLGVAGATVIYGLGLAGVSMGWMLGPVTLAGRSERVPQYVAIHATLVGIRGIVFQGLGMLLYQLTQGFTAPLLLATGAFLWAAFQMWRLQSTHRSPPACGTGLRPVTCDHPSPPVSAAPAVDERLDPGGSRQTSVPDAPAHPAPRVPSGPEA